MPSRGCRVAPKMALGVIPGATRLWYRETSQSRRPVLNTMV
jgi:hypothetical protein